MSWSFSADGPKQDVAQEIEQALPGIAASQGWGMPQAVQVRNLLMATLNAFPEGHITLSVSGHASGVTVTSNSFEPIPERSLGSKCDVIVPANG